MDGSPFEDMGDVFFARDGIEGGIRAETSDPPNSFERRAKTITVSSHELPISISAPGPDPDIDLAPALDPDLRSSTLWFKTQFDV